jgi:hypothetical protein
MKRYTRILVSAALLFGTASLGLVVSPLTAGASGGFDQYGYNNGARIFNGTYAQWCAAEGISSTSCVDYTFGSVNDLLIMKWNAAWDACNASYSTNPSGDPAACTGAWLDNESNGNVPGGSGYVWHYKIVYSSTCASDGTPSNGGYCVWGNYEVIMDQGTFGGVHTFNNLATPNGYGAYK